MDKEDWTDSLWVIGAFGLAWMVLALLMDAAMEKILTIAFVLIGLAGVSALVYAYVKSVNRANLATSGSRETDASTDDSARRECAQNISRAHTIVRRGLLCRCGGTMRGVYGPNGAFVRNLKLNDNNKFTDDYLLLCNKCGGNSIYKHPCPHLDEAQLRLVRLGLLLLEQRVLFVLIAVVAILIAVVAILSAWWFLGEQ